MKISNSILNNRHPRKLLRPENKQRKLRKQLIQKHGRCTITGWTNPLEYQMAHIIPKKIGYHIGFKKTDSESNCMLLANGLHSMFDGFEWTIDIYSFLDLGIDNNDYFKAFLIIKNLPGPGLSSISNYVNTLVNIPTKYYASVYAHYYTYFKYNYSSCDPALSFKNCIDNPLFKSLSLMTKTTEIKKYILGLRKGIKECFILLNDKNGSYKALWNYWSYGHISWAKKEQLSESILEEYLDHTEGLTDPTWIP